MLLRQDSQEARVLKTVPYFRDLSRSDLEKVGSVTTQVEMPVGELLCKEGHGGREFGVLVSGTAEVTRNGKKLAELGPGDFFGELSLLDGGLRTATITVTSPVSLLVVDGRSFWPLLETAPELLRSVVEHLCQRLREAQAEAQAMKA